MSEIFLAVSLVSAIASLFVLFNITQFSDLDNVKDTAQLINGILSIFQKLLKFHNGITFVIPFIPALLTLLISPNFSITLDL